ncbi:hypothetical protein VaNZ11_013139, partial [Volvox africanus]
VEDLNVASTCPGAGSVPVLDGQSVGAATARIGLRRTASVVLSKKGRDNGGGGGGCGAGEDDDGGDGGRGISGVRHKQLRSQIGGRVSTTSLRNLFAQDRFESPLSAWGRSQWDLATATGSESEPLQVDLCGNTDWEAAPSGRTRGISTTAVAIPEDSPFIDPVPVLSSHAPLAAANSFHHLSDIPPPPSQHTFSVVAPSSIFQLARHQHRELMEGVLVPTTVASGASGDLNSAATATVRRPCPSLKSFATSSAAYSSTGALPRLAEGTSDSCAAAAAAVEKTFPGGSGSDGIDDGATHVILPSLGIGGKSGPPLSGFETQASMGSQRTRAFVLKIMNMVGVEGGVTRPPSVTMTASARGGGTGGGTSAAYVQHCWPVPELAHELSPKPLGIGEGTKDYSAVMSVQATSQDCETRAVAVSAVSAVLAEAVITRAPAQETAPLPSTSRSVDRKDVLPSEFSDAPGFGGNSAADVPMGIDDTWMWNCAPGTAMSGSRSYGCVTVTEREKAMRFCECGCRCDSKNALKSWLKEHHMSGAPDRVRIPAEVGMCMRAADSEGQRGSSLGCAVEFVMMTGSGCRCKSATGHTSNSFSRRLLQGIRKLVFCGP